MEKILMLSHLKLRGRLLFGYAVPVILSLGFTGFAYSTIHQVFKTFQEVERVQNVIINMDIMAQNREKMVRSFRGYLVVQNTEFLAEYQGSLDSFFQAAKSASKLIHNPSQKERLTQMINRVESFDQFARQVIGLVNQGKSEAAINLFKVGNEEKLLDEFESLSQIFTKTEEAFLKNSTDDTEQSLNQLLYILGMGSTVLIIFSIVVAWFITWSISEKINRVVRAISTSSTEIVSTMIQQESMATQQASSVNQTTTTMDQLGAASKTTAQQAEAAASGAKQALELAEGGIQAVTHTLEGMATLKEKVDAITQHILRLSEQTSQIGNITDLVGDLANQTNMLALNAAVEAVRAGEHGKGFAVVAGEIRKLADESKRSAQKINGLVSDIQTAINTTVIVTDAGTKTVEQGVKIAQKTADAFSGVREAVNNVVINNQQIMLTAQQQAIAIDQVAMAMNVLNQEAIETVKGLNQTKLGTQKLNEASLELKAVV